MRLEAFTGTWADKMLLYTSDLIVQLPSAVASSINISACTCGSHTFPNHNTTQPCLTDKLVCFWILGSLYSSSLWYRIISISSVQNTFSGSSLMYFFTKVNLAVVFLWLKSALHLEASVFIFIISSVDSSLWQRQTCLLKTGSDLLDRLLKMFLYCSEDSSVISNEGLPWPTSPFAITELADARSLMIFQTVDMIFHCPPHFHSKTREQVIYLIDHLEISSIFCALHSYVL